MNTAERLIAIDLMDTLVHDPWREALEAATGLTLAEINARRDIGVWHKFEIGDIDEAAYWQHFAEQGIPANAATFHRVRRENYRWLPGAQELLRTLQAGRYPIAIATNYPVWLSDVEDSLLADYSLPVFASTRMGVRKPHDSFFERLAVAFRITPSAVILIDDTQANIDAVTSLGGVGILHTSAEGTKQLLKNQEIL